MKNIIHLLNTDRYSGAENVAIQIIKENRFQNTNFYYVSKEGPIKKNLAISKIKFRFFKSYISLLSTIKKLKPNIIHIHDFTLLVVIAIYKFLGLLKNVYLISHLHSNPKWIKAFNLRIIATNFAIAVVNKVVCVSLAIKEEIILIPFLKSKLEVIGNPIYKHEIKQQVLDNQFPQKKYDLLFVGRLVEEKQPFLFLDLVKLLKNHYPNLKSCMLGEGKLKDSLMRKIELDKLTSNVTLLGFVNNTDDFYNNSKLLVVPSIFEGFGLVVIEAMSYGIPILANSVGGLKFLVKNSFGKLVTNNNLNDYVYEIKKLLNDEDYYQLKSKNALKSYFDLLKFNKTYFDSVYSLYGYEKK